MRYAHLPGMWISPSVLATLDRVVPERATSWWITETVHTKTNVTIRISYRFPAAYKGVKRLSDHPPPPGFHIPGEQIITTVGGLSFTIAVPFVKSLRVTLPYNHEIFTP